MMAESVRMVGRKEADGSNCLTGRAASSACVQHRGLEERVQVWEADTPDSEPSAHHLPIL